MTPEAPFTLDQMAPDRPRRRWLWPLVGVVAVLVVVVAGVAVWMGTRSSAPGASPTAPPPSLAAACDRNEQIWQAAAGDLTNYGDDISQIYQDAPVSVQAVRDAAQALHDAWAASATNPGSFSATAALAGASLRLKTACIRAGWKAP